MKKNKAKDKFITVPLIQKLYGWNYLQARNYMQALQEQHIVQYGGGLRYEFCQQDMNLKRFTQQSPMSDVSKIIQQDVFAKNPIAIVDWKLFDDGQLVKALKWICTCQKVSIADLQRNLHTTFATAGHTVSLFQSAGYLGEGFPSCKVLLTEQQFLSKFTLDGKMPIVKKSGRRIDKMRRL